MKRARAFTPLKVRDSGRSLEMTAVNGCGCRGVL